MRQELELARQFIEEKQYDKARMLLLKVPGDPLALKWLEKLDEVAPPVKKPNGNGHGPLPGWQYASLELKRSYGMQYRFNGRPMPEWKDQPIHYALNELGREGWELVGFEGRDELIVYILKKAGAVLENKRVEVWDQ